MSSWQIGLAILALANLKSWPGMFHIKFYYYLLKYFVLQRKIRVSLWHVTNYWTHTPLLEIDFNLHKSNSTYFSDMDIARTSLMANVFKPFFLSYAESDPGSPQLKPHEWTYTPLGSVSLVFRHEIPPYVPYNVRSRVLGWTDKWLFVLSKFEVHGKVHAYGISKYVFKLKRKTVSPERAIRWCGLWNEEAAVKNAAVHKYLGESLDLESIIDVF